MYVATYPRLSLSPFKLHGMRRILPAVPFFRNKTLTAIWRAVCVSPRRQNKYNLKCGLPKMYSLRINYMLESN